MLSRSCKVMAKLSLYQNMEYLAGRIVQSGNNCNRIRTVKECEEMARMMGLQDTTAFVGSWPSEPPFGNMEGCGSAGCKTLYFNKFNSSKVPCRSGDRCICRATGNQF